MIPDILHPKIVFILSLKKLRPIIHSASTASTTCYSMVQSQFQEMNWGKMLWLVRRWWWWETSVVQSTVQDYILVLGMTSSFIQKKTHCNNLQLQTDPVAESLLLLSVRQWASTVQYSESVIYHCQNPSWHFLCTLQKTDISSQPSSFLYILYGIAIPKQ